MYDPNYDLLRAEWSVFEPAPWLLPLLSEYSDYRATITDIQKHVYSWSNYTDVLFIADFPGELSLSIGDELPLNTQVVVDDRYQG